MKRTSQEELSTQRRLPPLDSKGIRMTRSFVMDDPHGFHARPAMLLARTARQFVADVKIRKKGGAFVNAKNSILRLLTLDILRGDTLEVAVQGDDAAEATAAIENLFAIGFSHCELDIQPTPDAVTEVRHFTARVNAQPVFA